MHLQVLNRWAAAAGHNYISTEHILLGLLREGEGVAARVLETLAADPSKIRSQVPALAQHARLPHVQPQARPPRVALQLLESLPHTSCGVTCRLPPAGCTGLALQLLSTGLPWQVIRMVGESNETVAAGGVSGTGSNKMPTLDEYGNNLTQQAREVRPRCCRGAWQAGCPVSMPCQAPRHHTSLQVCLLHVLSSPPAA